MRCLVDTSIILTHHGMVGVKVWDIPEMGLGLPKWGDPLIDNLPDQIAAWLGVNEAFMPALLHRDTIRALDDSWLLWRRDHPEQPEIDWYRERETGDLYTMELARWHINGGGTPIALSNQCAGKRVLSYGGGIGTFALRAARAGADTVVVYEVNQRMRDFTMYRAERLFIDSVVDDMEIIATSDIVEVQQHANARKFDVIESWHMLEHVDDPCEVLEAYKAMLAPDGMLFFDCDFNKNGDDNHMHHELQEFGHTSVEEMMRAHGFVSQGVPYVYNLVLVEEVARA